MPGEPTPVYEGGPPGDAARVRYFIAREDAVTHGGPGSLWIGLFSLAWIDPVPVPPPPPAPPPVPPPPPGLEQTCPEGWATHASGFWRNTVPCPNNHGRAGCTGPDAANHTVVKLISRRRKFCHSPAPPSPFSSCFNRDGERVSIK